ncbi:MAG: restriction endonuclease subunit S [bacterium]|nr:restriction endonuclease subunit S [bacterium]
MGKDFTCEQIFYTDISSVGTGISDAPTEIPLSDAPSRARRLVKDGDTILSTVRPNRRSFLYLKEPEKNRVVSTGFAVLRAGDKIDSRFLYYLVSNQPFTDYLTLHAKGAAYPAIDEDIIANVDVVLPDLNDQKQIAGVLSAYDDLIENNTKRIKILEQIAQAIYREWFVYFRFPDHGKVKMIDSKTEFGKIPEGWKIGKLSDLAKITMGQSPSSDFYNEIGEGSPFHQGVTNFEFRFPTTTTFSTEGARKADEEDILFSVRAPVGRINVADRNIIIGRGLAAVKSISGNQSYLLYDFKHIFQTEDLIGGGAIFASVTKDDLNNFPVVIPDTKVIEQFESNVQPIDQLILNISHELSVLRNSRDLLLPKLVSGEIQV